MGVGVPQARSSRQPDISAIIVTWNGRHLLDTCLNALRTVGAADRVSIETIVVDNGSSDGTCDHLRRAHAYVRLVRNSENRGFAAGVNAGLREARGRYSLLLNSDARVQPGALRALVDSMDRRTDVGLLACRLENPDGSLQPSINLTFPGMLSLVGAAAGLQGVIFRIRRHPALRTALKPWHEHLHGRFRTVAWAGGTCLLVRPEAVRKVGPLDERFFFFQEDADWCRRMWRDGWRVAYIPDARVVHEWGASSRRADPEIIARLFESHWRYYEKYYTGPVRVAARSFLRGGLRARVWTYGLLSRLTGSESLSRSRDGCRLALERI
ncbi:MAG: glycosyltransferase family 2 protein [Nitrospirae bacterium]|nr:glycosyltransferase family 2 protein [Nitrospirota bacterium]